MKKGALAAFALIGLGTNVLAADVTSQPSLDALDARIRSLEAQAQQLREQAATALAEAQLARSELERMRTDQQSAQVEKVSANAELSAPVSAGANGNAFNPAISIILNGLYTHHSMNPDDYLRVGFPLVGEGGPNPKGLSLGESEVSLAANIDDKFYGQLTLSYGESNGSAETSIEEAFIDTTALPDGFTVRAGKFFSNIGYLNGHHAHTDNFADRPLVYQAFLGNQYGDSGVQARWVAPLDFYLELGGELFRGDNFPAGGAGNGGIGARTLFAHAGGDVGIENSWLAGISLLKTSPRDGEDGFSGDSKLYVADATWKWSPNGNTKDGGVTLRGEYFFERRDGRVALPQAVEALHGDRRGAYLEGVYRINRIWDAGYRYDELWAADSGPFASSFDPRKHSVMLTWHNSEFSLLRVELSHDEPNADSSDNSVTLQYQVSLGAHGAHKF